LTDITVLALSTGLASWVMAQSTRPVPSANAAGNTQVGPAELQAPKHSFPDHGNPNLPSPNDDRINQMTPWVTIPNGTVISPEQNNGANYTNGQVCAYPTNWNGSIFRGAIMEPAK